MGIKEASIIPIYKTLVVFLWSTISIGTIFRQKARAHTGFYFWSTVAVKNNKFFAKTIQSYHPEDRLEKYNLLQVLRPLSHKTKGLTHCKQHCA